jgi:GNAT superfamily N-acetyltransferase
MQARMVPPRAIASAWPLVVRWVAAALVNGKADIGPEDVRHALERGSMQLWLAWDDEARVALGCWVTEVCESIRGKCCSMVVVAGEDFKAWRQLHEAVVAWARQHGCVRLEGGGRDGWLRLMRAEGWRKLRTVIEMRLDEHG